MLLNVNGEEHSYRGAADTPLLWVLRDALGLTRLHQLGMFK